MMKKHCKSPEVIISRVCRVVSYTIIAAIILTVMSIIAGCGAGTGGKNPPGDTASETPSSSVNGDDVSAADPSDSSGDMPSPAPSDDSFNTPAANEILPVKLDWKADFPEMTAVELEDDITVITKHGLACSFDKSGLLKEIANGNRSLSLEGVYIDVGVNEQTILNQVGYQSFLDFATWDLPSVTPRQKPLPELTLEGMLQDENNVVAVHSLGDFYWQTIYTFENQGLLKASVRLLTTSDDKKYINGVTFIAKGMDIDYSTTKYEFPGNIPGRVYNMADYPASYVARTDYCNPVVHFDTQGSHLNVMFIDEQEKWGTGVYRNKDGGVNVANTAAVEAYLAKGDALEVGDLYIQFPGDDPYASVVEFYTAKGWVAPKDGVSDGPLYSCHPFGTMDSGFRDLTKLQEYAGYLDTIHEMGYKNVWLLPIFEHPGNNVYTSSDFKKIDSRYGGDEGLKVFTDRAHELGMRVMLDYVPHGPYPHMPLAKNNPDWCSKNIEGNLQIEWDCVSFDYNHPGFYQHMVESVTYHAQELGVDGARIDCAMGGLSNWNPVEGLRPSSSSLRAGLNVTKAIREGFLKGGKAPILLPENFHPVPFYAPYTDVFYDMTLYRMMYDMRERNVDETNFAKELSRWLSVQRATSPEGLVRLRFISNHDVVSWVWDSARPVKTYGVEKAKAVWTLTHFIDGIPMIYQGDENPEIYRSKGENLVDFFAGLNKAREQYLGHDYDIEYILNDSAVVAFRRFNDAENRLVLINLSENEQTFDAAGFDKILYSSGVSLNGNIAVLEPYGSAIINEAE